MSNREDYRVLWLSGPFKFRKEKMEALRGFFSNAEWDYIDDSCNWGYFSSRCLSKPVFAKNRVVVVHSLPNVPGSTKKDKKAYLKKQLPPLIEKTSKGNLIIFYDLPDSIKDELWLKKWLKTKKSLAQIWDAPKEFASEREAVSYVLDALSENKKKVGRDEAQALVELCGYKSGGYKPSFDKVNVAIDRLLSYVGKSKDIKNEDVISSAVSSPKTAVGLFYESLDTGDLKKAFNLIANLNAESAPTDVAAMLIAMTYKRARLLLYLREATENGMPLQKAVEGASEVQVTTKEGVSPLWDKRQINLASGIERPPFGPMSSGKPPYLRYDRGTLTFLVDACAVASEQMRRFSDYKQLCLLGLDWVLFTATSKMSLPIRMLQMSHVEETFMHMNDDRSIREVFSQPFFPFRIESVPDDFLNG